MTAPAPAKYPPSGRPGSETLFKTVLFGQAPPKPYQNQSLDPISLCPGALHYAPDPPHPSHSPPPILPLTLNHVHSDTLENGKAS